MKSHLRFPKFSGAILGFNLRKMKSHLRFLKFSGAILGFNLRKMKSNLRFPKFSGAILKFNLWKIKSSLWFLKFLEAIRKFTSQKILYVQKNNNPAKALAPRVPQALRKPKSPIISHGYKDKSAWFQLKLPIYSRAEYEKCFARYFLVIRDIGCQLVNRIRVSKHFVISLRLQHQKVLTPLRENK